MNKLAPSILSADFMDLGRQVKIIDEAGCDLIHVDVMDGHFVPNITLGTNIVSGLKKITDKPLDVHLMVTNPDSHINSFCEAGADIITVHAEACTHLHRTIQSIKEHNVKACVALNPATDLSVLEYILEDLDMVLIMTVNPGFGGQKFIPQSIEKIKKLRNIIESKKLHIDIQVDGGIKLDNVSLVLDAGANVIVAGSAIYKDDIVKNVQDFKVILGD